MEISLTFTGSQHYRNTRLKKTKFLDYAVANQKVGCQNIARNFKFGKTEAEYALNINTKISK